MISIPPYGSWIRSGEVGKSFSEGEAAQPLGEEMCLSKLCPSVTKGVHPSSDPKLACKKWNLSPLE